MGTVQDVRDQAAAYWTEKLECWRAVAVAVAVDVELELWLQGAVGRQGTSFDFPT